MGSSTGFGSLCPGNVFAKVSAEDVDWLDLAQIIRNRVAHNSEKAKLQYKTALNRLMNDKPDSPLPPGFAPGKFLIYTTNADKQLRPLMQDDHYWPDVFEGYISLWTRLANGSARSDACNSASSGAPSSCATWCPSCCARWLPVSSNVEAVEKVRTTRGASRSIP